MVAREFLKRHNNDHNNNDHNNNDHNNNDHNNNDHNNNDHNNNDHNNNGTIMIDILLSWMVTLVSGLYIGLYFWNAQQNNGETYLLGRNFNILLILFVLLFSFSLPLSLGIFVYWRTYLIISLLISLLAYALCFLASSRLQVKLFDQNPFAVRLLSSRAVSILFPIFFAPIALLTLYLMFLSYQFLHLEPWRKTRLEQFVHVQTARIDPGQSDAFYLEGGFEQVYGSLDELKKDRPEFRLNSRYVPLAQFNPNIVNALLEQEDAGYFSAGLLWKTLKPVLVSLRSAAQNLLGGGTARGGSTLYHQLLQGACVVQEEQCIVLDKRKGQFDLPLQKRLRNRKLWLEPALLLHMEMLFPQYSAHNLDELLLERYLNSQSVGGLRGFPLAAQALFGKDQSQLNLPESILLAYALTGSWAEVVSGKRPLAEFEGVVRVRLEAIRKTKQNQLSSVEYATWKHQNFDPFVNVGVKVGKSGIQTLFCLELAGQKTQCAGKIKISDGLPKSQSYLEYLERAYARVQAGNRHPGLPSLLKAELERLGPQFPKLAQANLLTITTTLEPKVQASLERTAISQLKYLIKNSSKAQDLYLSSIVTDHGRITAAYHAPALPNQVAGASPVTDWAKPPASSLKPLLLGFWADHAELDLQQKTFDDNIGKGIVNLGGCGIPKYASQQSWQNILIASHNTAFVRRGNRMNPRQAGKLVQFMAQIMDLDDTFRASPQDPTPNPKTLSSYFFIGGDVLTFSPLALSLAYDAFRNGGKVYQPYLVQQISIPDPKTDLSKANRTVYLAQPKSQQLFSSATAQHILELLRGVVDAHCLIKFGPETSGVQFAGKTGTLSVDQRLELQYWTAILSPDYSLNVLLANVKPIGNLEDNLGQILSYQNGNSPASSLAKHIASDLVVRGLERKKRF